MLELGYDPYEALKSLTIFNRSYLKDNIKNIKSNMPLKKVREKEIKKLSMTTLFISIE